MPHRKISFASGIAPGLPPAETVRAAVEGGFDAVGLWVDPAAWTAATTREVRSRLADGGIGVLDVEVIWIRPGPDDPNHFRLLDIGAEIGAANALVVCSDPDRQAAKERFARLCAHGERLGLRVCLEFGLFTDVHTIAEARAIVDANDSPARGLLIDTLHLDRSGGTARDIASVPPSLLPYAQICDAPAHRPEPGDKAAIREEAVDLRLQVGEGAIALPAMIEALPPLLPFSVELRSKALRETYPDPVERARVTASITRAYLEKLDQPR